MLEMVKGLTEKDLVICLVSGGGSALLALPAKNITLEEKQQINRKLLRSGASISEMNCVRKHLSDIKGGPSGIGLCTGEGRYFADFRYSRGRSRHYRQRPDIAGTRRLAKMHWQF